MVLIEEQYDYNQSNTWVQRGDIITLGWQMESLFGKDVAIVMMVVIGLYHGVTNGIVVCGVYKWKSDMGGYWTVVGGDVNIALDSLITDAFSMGRDSKVGAIATANNSVLGSYVSVYK